MATRTTKSKTKSVKLKRNRTPKLIFAAFFAAVVVYVLFRSFAATNTSYIGAPPVGIAAASKTADGYWIAASDGGVFSQGTAVFHGSEGASKLNAPIVGISATSDYGGYWLVGRDGGVFSFGDAANEGSIPGLGKSVNNIVGMSPTSNSGGYWLVSSTGAVYSFGNAQYEGSAGQINPKLAPGGSNSVSVSDIVGIASTPSGKGYWLVGADGGIFSFGDAQFEGSLPSKKISTNGIVGMFATNTSLAQGYWLVGSNGSIFSFGNAPYRGSSGEINPSLPAGGSNAVTVAGSIVGMAATYADGGYWQVSSVGAVYSYGNAQFEGRQTYSPPTASITANTTNIVAGQPVTLSWQTTNATTELITDLSSVGPSGHQVVYPHTTTTYTLTATTSTNSATSSITITVTPAQSSTTTPHGYTPPPNTPTVLTQQQKNELGKLLGCYNACFGNPNFLATVSLTPAQKTALNKRLGCNSSCWSNNATSAPTKEADRDFDKSSIVGETLDLPSQQPPPIQQSPPINHCTKPGAC